MNQRFRVEELAAETGVSVDTIRYYQHRGLLPPPEREGRLAYYSDSHVARLRRIKELKAKGLSLSTIGRVLNGLHPADAALVTAVAETGEGGLTLEELAAEAGVPEPLLRSLVAEGILTPANPEAERPYGPADVQALRAGIALLDAGVPLSRLLELGRSHNAAMDRIAEEAVAIFDRYVRKPAREAGTPDDARDQVLAAFERLLPAASLLVRQSFERALLRAAQRRIEEAAREEPSASDPTPTSPPLSEPPQLA